MRHPNVKWSYESRHVFTFIFFSFFFSAANDIVFGFLVGSWVSNVLAVIEIHSVFAFICIRHLNPNEYIYPYHTGPIVSEYLFAENSHESQQSYKQMGYCYSMAHDTAHIFFPEQIIYIR